MITNHGSIPGYEILEELYHGSRTIVYRAIREGDRLPVVVKLLRNPSPTPQEIFRFRHQYTVTQKLDIAGVVPIYSFDVCGNSYMLVMEDFGGISLCKYFGEGNRGVGEVLGVAVQVAGILEHVHQQGVIHKDIKPANILIEPQSGQVKLIDFSIAALVSQEIREVGNLDTLEGTLAYLSPEQTGRMNRGMDYRSDFYSLGVTLYELLTGELPFAGDDPMELVYAHLTKNPPAFLPNKGIPTMVERIVGKLMAKNPEDRYQSAGGLKFDLQRCWQEYQQTGTVNDFILGQRDTPMESLRDTPMESLRDRMSQLRIPEKLYGRENQVKTLLDAFTAVQEEGGCQVVVVCGYSGVGKTSLIRELLKPVTASRGHFISGKFDQLQRDVPYACIAASYGDLIRQILSEGKESVEYWRDRFLAAVGSNGRLVIDLIPELELLIGQQPSLEELPVQEAQNRFEQTLMDFATATGSPKSPLVEFIDDVQWANLTTISFLKRLLTSSQTQHRLVILAYRDNEVDPTHPFIQALTEIEAQGLSLTRIVLDSLSLHDVMQLIADTLNCHFSRIQPLAKLLYEKTQGNPFFLIQLLKSLQEGNLLSFERETGEWKWDVTTIRQQNITDNVVELMIGKLRNLFISTQEVLRLAACIGDKFDLQTLGIISQQSPQSALKNLWPAIAQNLVIPLDKDYKLFLDEIIDKYSVLDKNPRFRFQHDRIQEAAYCLIPQERKQQVHKQIAELLLQNISSEKLAENIFEIVNHANQAVSLFTNHSEREKFAQLNLMAGRKAKAAIAYESALNYFHMGLEFIHFTSKIISHSQEKIAKGDLILALLEEKAEAAYCCGRFAEMEECLKIIFTKTTNKLDRIKAYEIQIQAYAVQHRFLDAIAIARTALQEFSLNLPETVTFAETMAALTEVQNLLADKTETDLLNLPVMVDTESIAITNLLSKITPAIYSCKPDLYPIIILTQVKQLVLHGNNSDAAFIYATYGALQGIILEDIDAVYEFGQLALQMVSKLNHYSRSKVNLTVAQVNLHCKQHYRESLPLLIEGYQVGMAVGEREFAGYNAGYIIHCAYLTGVNLKTVINDAQAYIQQLQKFNLLSALDLANIAIFAAKDLENFLDKSVVKSQKEEFYSRIHKTGGLNGLCLYWFYEMIHEYLCDRREETNQANLHVHQTIVSLAGTIFIPLFHFYDSLVALNNYPHCTDENEKEEILERVKNNQQKLLHRAHHAPMNFQHKYDLVAAEMHRILGNIPEAMQIYDEAIQGALAHDYIQEAALANERAAEFYLEINKPKIAWIYLQDAHQYYQEWGAKVKVQQLETKYSQLFKLKSQSSNYLPRNLTQTFTQTRGSSSTAIQLLDLGTVMKAATAISSEIILEKLLHKLLQIILENAGAQKGCIILEQDGDLYVEVADCNQEIREVVVNKVSLETSESFPVELIQYVVRTQEVLILNNATKEGMFINNPYIVRNQPKSILCLPIFSQGKFLGLVYLENNLLKAAFTSDRLEIIKILTSQAAIAIENAQLYSREQEKAKELAQKEQQYRSIFESVNDGLGIWDLETGECLAVNPANCRMYGYSQEEFLKITAADFIHPDYLHVFTESLQAVTAGKDFYGHAIVIRKDGSQFDIEVRGTRCFYNGKYQGLFIGRDISQQKAAEREKARAEAEIKRKNQELEQALMQLQQSQAQVIQSEKMSALGNLVAGVAHEINNPIGFLNGSIKNAQDYIQDILDHLQLYQEQVEATTVIQESAEEIDLEFLMEDLPKILLGMQTATERIKNISNSLRTFSRADTEHKVTANIHDGLESTLLILKYRLKANEHRPAIEVIREYGDLPPIECFPGQLNQVFMNILANAIDMFDEMSQNQSIEELKAHPQQIRISTSMADEELQIRIRDNGKGMTPEIQSKIFEHLFTTKGVGKGTGLGLAIAKQIIEETHAGQLTCVSHLGQGTEFIITIPTK